jgi:hypothetical protein
LTSHHHRGSSRRPARPQEVQPEQPKPHDGRGRPKTGPPTDFTPRAGSLLQRGNYAMFRILSIIAGAGAGGITTVALHQELGAHTNRTNAIIRTAHEMGLIDRIQGERPGPGQFAPILNVITKRGRKLLASAVQ